MADGKPITADKLIKKALNYRAYFGKNGGITLSGGEPLLQADFVCEVFSLAKQNGINTCLDTSGCFLNDSVKQALNYTDRVLLDIKYTSDDLYKKHVGMVLDRAIAFLELLNEKKIPTTIRQVIIPTVNDTAENIDELAKIINAYPCVDSVELLPFKKICQTKYDSMGIDFPFGHLAEASPSAVLSLENELKSKLYLLKR